jgi:hypothetical protein
MAAYLESQPVASVAAAVDDVERRHWQHKVGVASQVSEVLVQWYSLLQCIAQSTIQTLLDYKHTCKTAAVRDTRECHWKHT